MEKFLKKTKIVATLGPATNTFEDIETIILKGANVLRLNTSHGSVIEHQNRIDIIKKIEKKLNLCVGIMVDLQGPKIRIGELQKEILLENNQEIIFSSQKNNFINCIPVDYDGIANDVKDNDLILIDDGKIIVKVNKVQNDKVYAKIINGGILKSRKGLNIPGSTASLDTVTKRDIEFIKFAVKNEVDYIALSFVRKKEDVEVAKKYINDLGGDIPIVSKIEKPDALKNLKEIIFVSDYVMVARGDLGIELSCIQVPIEQKKIIEEANLQKKGVIVATQMLESMINEPIPTRAEASDVANAILDGADAIMLSGETSVGAFAPQAVEIMAKIAHKTEKSRFYQYDLETKINDNYALTRQAIVFAADKMINYVKPKALIVFTHKGYSARLMSKLKPSVPIIAVSNLKSTCSRLALNWGVYPILKDWDVVVNAELINKFDDFLKSELNLKKGDYVIITGSAPHLISGKTNFTRVHKIYSD